MHTNGERAGDFESSLLSTTNSDLVKLDLIITEEAPAEAAPLSLACKLQISGTELEGGARRQVTLTSSEEKILRVLKALEKEEGAPFLLQHAQQPVVCGSQQGNE
jgi:hypothetical protein